MQINKIFLSLQGESTFMGLPCIFIRFAGCNLNCHWCDTPEARSPEENSTEMSVARILEEVCSHSCRLVELTGGEPLLQSETDELICSLLALDKTVLVETNGSTELAGIDERVIKVVDVKCPSSGHEGSFLESNLDYITEKDEIKFVIGDRGDFNYAKDFIDDRLLGRTAKILFSPVMGRLEIRELASWILEEKLDVRLQMQMHKEIWHDSERL